MIEVLRLAAELVAVLAVATVLGRALTGLLPYRIRGYSASYLAPAIGLSFILVFIAVLGRHVPMADLTFPLYAVGAAGIAMLLAREPYRKALLRQCLGIAAFGVVASVGILSPVLRFGTLAVHNDAFTYIAISDWLQTHAFAASIPPESVTPLSSQVYLYQHFDLRMGASYLMGLLQALFRHRWGFDTYPLLCALGVAISGLIVGFPARTALRRFSRPVRYLILTVPAVSYGGIAFAAAFGFLPQLFGVALGAAALFLWDAVVNAGTIRLQRRIASSFVVAVLIAASTFCYPEFSPLLGIAFLASTIARVVWDRFATFWPLAQLTLATLLWVGVMLNVELIRAFHSVELQRGAVVGTPVDWGLIGFLAHALGIHGGAWDEHQWSLISAPELWVICGTLATLAIVGATIWGLVQGGKRIVLSAGTLAMVVLSFLAILYLRYAAPNPFASGLGQSWSQFKIADWAHPFVAALVFIALLPLARHRGVRMLLVVACTIGLFASASAGIARVAPTARQYVERGNVGQYLADLREAVTKECASRPAVYLDLGGQNHKMRQIVALFLPDMLVRSDWIDDGYIAPWLPPSERRRKIELGDCVVGPPQEGGEKLARVGPLEIWVADGSQTPQIHAVGDYEVEGQGNEWWIWVKSSVTLNVNYRGTPFKADLVLMGSVTSRADHLLTISSHLADGSVHSVTQVMSEGERPIEVPLSIDGQRIESVSLASDAVPQRISSTDPRLVTFLLRDAQAEVKGR